MLLYTRSTADPRKRARALELFDEYAGSGRIVLSTQVIQEFYAAGSRKLSLPRSELQQASAALMDLPLIRIDTVHIREAMRGEDLYRISFWDSGGCGRWRRTGALHRGFEPRATVRIGAS